MKNININNKGEEPINPTWVTKNGEKSHRALKSGEKTDYEHHLGGLTKREYFGKILAKGGENSTTDELCRNVDKSANAHFNYRLPAFCQYIVSCRFSSAYNLTK
jgi:hypothetical protein